jgi:hypothetical protein
MFPSRRLSGASYACNAAENNAFTGSIAKATNSSPGAGIADKNSERRCAPKDLLALRGIFPAPAEARCKKDRGWTLRTAKTRMNTCP